MNETHEPNTQQSQSTPAQPADDVLLAAHDIARNALAEVVDPATIGEPVGHVVEGERVLSLLFASKLSGYPDWHWSVSLARYDEHAEPSVLEVALLPGETSIVAPEWIPWSVRLKQFREAQQALAAQAALDGVTLDAAELDLAAELAALVDLADLDAADDDEDILDDADDDTDYDDDGDEADGDDMADDGDEADGDEADGD